MIVCKGGLSKEAYGTYFVIVSEWTVSNLMDECSESQPCHRSILWSTMNLTMFFIYPQPHVHCHFLSLLCFQMTITVFFFSEVATGY